MEHRNGEGSFDGAVDRLAKDVGALVSVERGVKHLDLDVGLGFWPTAEEAFNSVHNVADIAIEVFERPLPVEIENDLLDCQVQPVPHRVVARIDGRIREDVLGRNGRAGENVVVMEIRSMQKP